MEPKSRVGRRRPAIRIALAIATLSGCATRPSSLRPDGVSDPPAPDLLSVSAIAPAINAGPDRREVPPRPAAVASRAEPRRPIDDPAVAPASDPPAVDSTSVASRTGPPPSAAGPVETPGPGRPDVNPEAGLMGPTPAVPTPAATTPPTIPQSAPPFPIDLSAALRLADGQNPLIGEARIMIMGALAARQGARALLLPYLNVGTNYHDHTGPLQRSGGSILPITEQSLYVGGGARTVAAESVSIPAVNIFSPLTDAIYEPLATQQRVVGARFNASDTANKVLLEVASLYIQLIGAEATLVLRREIAGDADRIADSVAAYAATGQGRKSDANRAEADRRLFQVEIPRAEEQVAVASALLAQRLNLDPSAQLRPLAGPLEPIELVDPEAPAEELIRSAVGRRPDLASREAIVSEARYRVREEIARPLLPTIWLGFSGGAFGGGSNFTATPLGSFAGRTDFDVRAYWTLLNLGAGNASLIKKRKAQVGQAMADRSAVLNEIRAEVGAARAESLALRSQVTNARFGVRTSEDGYRQDQARLRESLSLPIEALDSLRLLSDAKVALIRAITRANQAQFALFVSLGAPPPLDSPLAAPQPVPPTAGGGG